MNFNILSNCRRVVVTGIGIVSPLGCGSINIYDKIIKSKSGISLLSSHINFNNNNINEIKVSANVPIGDGIEDYNEKLVFGRSVSREMSQFMQYAVYASDLALKNANIKNNNNEYIIPIDKDKFGVSISSAVGSLQEILDGEQTLRESPRRLSPFFVPRILNNLATGHVSVRHNCCGPGLSAATACAAGAHAIGDALNMIRLGYADRMLAGTILSFCLL